MTALVSDKIYNNVTSLNVKIQDAIQLKYKCGNGINYLIICLTYIPPENSIYSKMSIFDEIEEHINDLQVKNENNDFCIMEELNAQQGI